MNNIYTKRQAVQTQGFAILTMLVLHLFCRTGANVYGTPLIWVNAETPLIYYFGFFAEICVPIYTICAGYAQALSYNKVGSNREHYMRNLRRILKLMINYWIILSLFSILGMIFPSDGTMPKSLPLFIKSIFLIHSYNGAWWFLTTYIILMLIPPIVLLFPVKKLHPLPGLLICFVIQSGYELLIHFGLLPEKISSYTAVNFIWTQFINIFHVLPYFYAGSFIFKGDYINKCNAFIEKHFPKRRNIVILILTVLLFTAVSIVHKAIIMPAVGAVVFVLFNLWEKGAVSEKIFTFLGRHSTNIWLTHMFFYLVVFGGTVQKLHYPLLILLGLLALCIATSYVIILIQKSVDITAKTIKTKCLKKEQVKTQE